MRSAAVLALALALAGVGSVAWYESPLTAGTGVEGMAKPKYNQKGELLRPEGYHSWIFVGASLGLSYREDGGPAESGPGSFHHVYLQPEAYRYYMETGRFPEQTMLALETYLPGSRESIGQGGYFEKEFAGLSIAVKDSAQFPDGWAYVSFTEPGGGLKESSGPFPKERCYDCHHQHGATDNVFTQFYPILRRSGSGNP